VIHVLVGFARRVSGAASPQEILPLLAEAAVERLGADAAAVLQVGAGDLRPTPFKKPKTPWSAPGASFVS
jgi:hypothetical protein